MIGRLFRARLKAAEAALSEGRLDEAFRLATSQDLATERRAQDVLRQAGDQLFARAEDHFKAERHAEALLDLDRALEAGVAPQRVADLRTIVHAAIENQARNQQSRHERLAEARDRIAQGSLRAAEDILDRASRDDARARQLKEQAEDRLQRAGELFQEVKQYYKEGHLSVAIARFRDARRLHPKDKQVAQWEKTLVERVVTSVNRALQEGKLNRGFAEMELLHDIGDERPAKRELSTILQHISQAARAIEAARYDDARRLVLGLQHLLPQPKWLKKAVQQLQQLDELTTELKGGPWGLIPQYAASRPPAAAAGRGQASAAPLGETIVGAPGSTGGALPDRLLVLVDGAGSFLLIRSPRASLGRLASSDPADIPIIADLAERHAEIVRADEDYFLYASREVNIGGQNLKQKLLQNGDKIILGKRAKLTFKLPSRKCSSAVLDLSDSAKMPSDVRRIILFDGLATLGRSLSAHIVAPTAGEDLVLIERQGQLWLRHRLNGKGDEGVRIELDRPFELAGVSMVVEEWKVRQ